MTLRKTEPERKQKNLAEQRKQQVYFKYPPDRRKVASSYRAVTLAVTEAHPPNNSWSDEDQNTGAYSSLKGNERVLDAVTYCLKKGRNPRKSKK